MRILSLRRTTLGLITLAIGVTAAASGCASAGGAHRGACAVSARDSAYLASGPVYPECGVQQPAKIVSQGMHPVFRPSNPRSNCYSVDMEFVVDTTGRVEAGTAKIVRTNDRDFADAVMATLPSWSYEPARLAGARVRQIVSARQSALTAVVRSGGPPPAQPLMPPTC